MDVTENTDIQSPLLSRFDLILLILDTKNAEWDEVISSFVLQAATGAAPLRAPCPQTRRPISTQPWTVDKVQKYIAWVREQHPAVGLSDDAKTVLEAYYRAQRQSENRSASRTTVRLLESLIRLTQAHARLMCRSTATLQDAVVSVICMETSVAATSLLSLQSALHSDFPEDPDHEFNVIERMILASLGLQQLQPASGSHGLSDD
jgi:DNA helicase MCM9